MTTDDRRRAGDAHTEEQRRARVVHGWAFRNLTPEQIVAIQSYLDGGPVPSGYEEADRHVR